MICNINIRIKVSPFDYGVIAESQLDVDALSGVEIVMPNGEMSPNKFMMSSSTLSPVPSISYTAVQNLGVGDAISQGGSAQDSAYNSCPYTPQNSCSEPAEGYTQEHYFLPSFNSRDMIEKIELKRGKLRGYDRAEDELKPGGCSSYPFTPKNSYVDSSLDSIFEQQVRSVSDAPNSDIIPAIKIYGVSFILDLRLINGIKL